MCAFFNAQVLYLDADNFVLRDTSVLFASQEYNNTAAIFWQDYWSNSLAPEVCFAVASLSGMLLAEASTALGLCAAKWAWTAQQLSQAPAGRAQFAAVFGFSWPRCAPVAQPGQVFSSSTFRLPAICCVRLQTAELLGVPQDQWPAGSFESGQMVIDKARHWRGLVMAMYINTYSRFW